MDHTTSVETNVVGPDVRTVPCLETDVFMMHLLLSEYPVKRLDLDLGDDGSHLVRTKRARHVDEREEYTEGMICTRARVSEVTLLSWPFRTLLLRVDASARHQQAVLRDMGLRDHEAWGQVASRHEDQGLRPLLYALGIRYHGDKAYVTTALLVFRDQYAENHELSLAPGGTPLLQADTVQLVGTIVDALAWGLKGGNPIRTAVQARTLHHLSGGGAVSPEWARACESLGFRDADTFVDFDGEGHHGPTRSWDQPDQPRWWRRSLLIIGDPCPSLCTRSPCPPVDHRVLQQRGIVWYRTDRCRVMVVVPRRIPGFEQKRSRITDAVDRMCASRRPDGTDGVDDFFATKSTSKPNVILFVAYEVTDHRALHAYFGADVNRQGWNANVPLPDPVAFSTMIVDHQREMQPWEWFNDVTCGVPGRYAAELLRLVFAIAYDHGVRAVRLESVGGSVGAWERHGYTRRETHCRRVPGRDAPVYFQSEENYGRLCRTVKHYDLMTRLVTEKDSFADQTVFRGERIPDPLVVPVVSGVGPRPVEVPGDEDEFVIPLGLGSSDGLRASNDTEESIDGDSTDAASDGSP